MNEFDVMELILLHAENVISSFTVFLSLLFSYMTVAYLAGKKLSTVQMAIISLIYSAASISWILSALTNAYSFESVVAEYPEYIRTSLWELPWSILVIIVTCSATVASLYFMYDVRRERKAHDEIDT